ncbi:hypothetical protein P8452_59616 [Trifolium repens]|nr:hypothetical protein P8452_59616 [Trifolium repens]
MGLENQFLENYLMLVDNEATSNLTQHCSASYSLQQVFGEISYNDDSEGNNRLLGTLSGVGSRAGIIVQDMTSLLCKCFNLVDETVPPYTCKKGHTTNDPLIKYSAATLLEKQKQLSLGDPQGYPLCLDDIMERKFAFRLKWQTSWGGQASVEQVVAINESPPIQV